MITGNKGEWSEIYALFKLLSDGQLNAGDADLNQVKEVFYPIVKIIRNEGGETFDYSLVGDLVIISSEVEKIRIPLKTFAEQSLKLLGQIKESSGSFALPEVEEFMHSVYCKTLKANSSTKTDINIVVHDTKINQTVELGFSIKSQLGGKATLLNAGKTTNFVFEIVCYSPTDNEIESINAISTKSKIKDKIIQIQNYGGRLQYQTLQQDVFKNNLILIDSLLPNILAELVELFYTTKYSRISELVHQMQELNPLQYDLKFAHNFYEYKIKRFLTDVALGMTPSKVWDGKQDANGGYLVVKENGDVLCYHIYNRNQFEDYLFQNTKLETASSTRHEFGKIYKKDNQSYFNLNLQIRFV